MLGTPAKSGDLVELADGGGIQQPTKGCGQTSQNHLRLRVAEPGVELDHPQPAGGQGQPDVEHTDEWRSAVAHLVHGRLRDTVDDVLDQGGRSPVQR